MPEYIFSKWVLADCYLLIIAMTPTEVTEKLQLNKLKDKIWYVVPSCATTGEGIFEGLVRLRSLHAHIRIRTRILMTSSLRNRVGYQTTSRHPHNKERPSNHSPSRLILH